MARPMKPSTELLERAASSPAVRAALRAKAARALPRAQRLAAAAGAQRFSRRLRVEEGTRPGSKAEGGFRRPYARVTATLTDDDQAADAGAKITRRQILRRASSA